MTTCRGEQYEQVIVRPIDNEGDLMSCRRRPENDPCRLSLLYIQAKRLLLEHTHRSRPKQMSQKYEACAGASSTSLCQVCHKSRLLCVAGDHDLDLDLKSRGLPTHVHVATRRPWAGRTLLCARQARNRLRSGQVRIHHPLCI